MNEKGWMKCIVRNRTKAEITLEGEIFDGTTFKLDVPFHYVTLTEDGKHGWLQIEYQGINEKENKVKIELPRPTLNMGAKMAIRLDQLNKNIFVKPDIVTQQAILPNKVVTSPFNPTVTKNS